LPIDSVVKSAISLKSRKRKDGGCDLFSGNLQFEFVGLMKDNGLMNQVIEGLLFEIQFLQEIIRQYLTIALAVEINKILIFSLEIYNGYSFAVNGGNSFSLLSSAHGTEIKNKDNNDNPQYDLHQPVPRVFPHQFQHGKFPPFAVYITDHYNYCSL